MRMRAMFLSKRTSLKVMLTIAWIVVGIHILQLFHLFYEVRTELVTVAREIELHNNLHFKHWTINDNDICRLSSESRINCSYCENLINQFLPHLKKYKVNSYYEKLNDDVVISFSWQSLISRVPNRVESFTVKKEFNSICLKI